jgi:hypothetical protein
MSSSTALAGTAMAMSPLGASAAVSWVVASAPGTTWLVVTIDAGAWLDGVAPATDVMPSPAATTASTPMPTEAPRVRMRDHGVVILSSSLLTSASRHGSPCR